MNEFISHFSLYNLQIHEAVKTNILISWVHLTISSLPVIKLLHSKIIVTSIIVSEELVCISSCALASDSLDILFRNIFHSGIEHTFAEIAVSDKQHISSQDLFSWYLDLFSCCLKVSYLEAGIEQPRNQMLWINVLLHLPFLLHGLREKLGPVLSLTYPNDFRI